MIHTLVVERGSEPEGLRKEFRKKLMTGGAVVRLTEGLTREDAKDLFERFSPEAKRPNLAWLVLRELYASGVIEASRFADFDV